MGIFKDKVEPKENTVSETKVVKESKKPKPKKCPFHEKHDRHCVDCN